MGASQRFPDPVQLWRSLGYGKGWQGRGADTVGRLRRRQCCLSGVGIHGRVRQEPKLHAGVVQGVVPSLLVEQRDCEGGTLTRNQDHDHYKTASRSAHLPGYSQTLDAQRVFLTFHGQVDKVLAARGREGGPPNLTFE